MANTIEFWTGIATRIEKHEDGTATIYRGDEVFTAIPVAPDKVEIYKDGQRVGVAATTEDGSLVVTDERGVVRLNTKEL